MNMEKGTLLNITIIDFERQCIGHSIIKNVPGGVVFDLIDSCTILNG